MSTWSLTSSATVVSTATATPTVGAIISTASCVTATAAWPYTLQVLKTPEIDIPYEDDPPL